MSGGPRFWESDFLELLPRVDGRIKVAAERVGVSRQRVHEVARTDPRFALALAEAKRKVVENDADEAKRRIRLQDG